MAVSFLKRNIFQRILGLPATAPPKNPGCWQYADGKLTIDLTQALELQNQGGALRLEGGGLPLRVLVVSSGDGQYQAFHNRCTHIGHRRLDPLPGGEGIQCCSIGKSTYDGNGQVIYGPAPDSIKTFVAQVDGDQLTVTID